MYINIQIKKVGPLTSFVCSSQATVRGQFDAGERDRNDIKHGCFSLKN
jgi:hypothetical protein